MAEIVPSSTVVKERLEVLETKLRRIIAVASAASSICSLLPATIPEVHDVQALVGILAEAGPAAMTDLQWLLASLSERAAQISTLLSSSAA